MKAKIVLLVLIVAGSVHAFGQISLTRENNTPRAKYRYFFDEVSFDYEAMRYSGQDTTWDFSDLNFLSDTLSYYYTRDSTYISFPESDYEWMCSDPPNPLDTNILRSDNAIYRVTDSLFYQNYEVRQIPESPWTCIDDVVIKCLKFPMFYESEWSYERLWNDNASNLYKKVMTQNADAYGTLILPDTTYTNVLRLHTFYDYNISYVSIHHDYWQKIDAYEWYHEDYQLPLLKLEFMSSFTLKWDSPSWEWDTTAWLFSHKEYIPLTLDTEEVESAQINAVKIFPCPAKNKINFLTDMKIEGVVLIDLYGKQVHTVFDLASYSMDISHVKNGLYLVQGRFDDGRRFSQKVIVAK